MDGGAWRTILWGRKEQNMAEHTVFVLSFIGRTLRIRKLSTSRPLTLLEIFLVEIRMNPSYLCVKFFQASLACGY